MIGDLARIGGEAAALLLVSGLAVAVWRPRSARGLTEHYAPLVIVVALAASGIVVVDGIRTAQVLRTAHRTAISPRGGLTYCFAETGAAKRVRFVNWLRRELPAQAIYALAFAPQPDEWCLTLALLPRVPQYGNDHPRWLVTWGVTPPAVQALISRHDPAVRIFAPGFSLVHLG